MYALTLDNIMKNVCSDIEYELHNKAENYTQFPKRLEDRKRIVNIIGPKIIINKMKVIRGSKVGTESIAFQDEPRE